MKYLLRTKLFQKVSCRPVVKIVSCSRFNEIDSMDDIRSLQCVGDLILTNNKLTSSSLYKWSWSRSRHLVNLQLGSNRVKYLPEDMCTATSLNQFQIQDNPLRSPNELGNLKHCISLIRIQTSFQSVACSCRSIATVRNTSLPLVFADKSDSRAFSGQSETHQTSCNAQTSLPVDVGTAVEEISHDIISLNCKMNSLSIAHVFLSNLCFLIICIRFAITLVHANMM